MISPLPGHVAAPADDHADLLASILRDQKIRSVFQPIVDLETKSVVAFEALARGPEGPLAAPDTLFSTARQAGMLGPLDEACRAAAFRGASAMGLFAPLTVFVNVEPGVVDRVPMEEMQTLASSIPGELRVVMEITERALASHPAALLRTADRVREFGWGVALDDVGADPASLAFMALLRPDVVKLDLSLVQQRATAAIAEIMSGVNAYAERSGALILAEGIETERHLMSARALGASLGQGWLFGGPSATPERPAAAGSMVLLEPHLAVDRDTLASPFDCLPAGTILRRSTKQLLIEVSKQLELEAIRLGEACVVASSFQYDRHFTPATVSRYESLAEKVGFVCALGEGLTASPAPGVRGVSLSAQDPMLGEWNVVVLSPHFSAALLARELGGDGPDHERLFEYAVTYERESVVAAACRMLARVDAGPVS